MKTQKIFLIQKTNVILQCQRTCSTLIAKIKEREKKRISKKSGCKCSYILMWLKVWNFYMWLVKRFIPEAKTLRHFLHSIQISEKNSNTIYFPPVTLWFSDICTSKRICKSNELRYFSDLSEKIRLCQDNIQILDCSSVSFYFFLIIFFLSTLS